MRFWRVVKEALGWLASLKNQADLGGLKVLIYLVVIAGLVTVGAGLILFLIDPNIHSPFDGLWYAWVTMTHVGYGDVVPTSMLGRLLAGLLILFGLGLFALFTAVFSAALIGKEFGAVQREVAQMERQTDGIVSVEDKILTELARIQQRLDELEKRIAFGSRQ